MRPRVAIFLNDPECSEDCCMGMSIALGSQYDVFTFSKQECNTETFKRADIIAFPGGIGDVSTYDKFFRRKAENAVADFVANGGYYLGICMGAYWAGSQWFDILDSVEPEQYIKRPGADVRRSYSTTAHVDWQGKKEDMFFYDGCALVGDESKFTTVARYTNNDPMAIIQGRVGLIGCHPESQKYWYEKPWQYINSKWHEGRHHNLLLEFVNLLYSK